MEIETLAIWGVIIYTSIMLLLIPSLCIYKVTKYPLNNIISFIQNPSTTTSIRNMIRHSQNHSLIRTNGRCNTCQDIGANNPRINSAVMALEGKAWIQVYNAGYDDGIENRKKSKEVRIEVNQHRSWR